MMDKKPTIGVDPALPGSEKTITEIMTAQEYARRYMNEWTPPDPEEKNIYVVARDHGTATLYARLKRINRTRFRYVPDENTLRGVDGVEIHFVTTCREHRRYYEIREVAAHLEELGTVVIKEVDW